MYNRSEARTTGVGGAGTTGVGDVETTGVGGARTTGVGDVETTGLGDVGTTGVGGVGATDAEMSDAGTLCGEVTEGTTVDAAETISQIPSASMVSNEVGSVKDGRARSVRLDMPQASGLSLDTILPVCSGSMGRDNMDTVADTHGTSAPILVRGDTPVSQAVSVGHGEAARTTSECLRLSSGPVVTMSSLGMPAVTTEAEPRNVPPRPVAVDGWARDARMVEAIFQVMEGLEPPWVTLDVMEVMAVRYPEVDRETLRLVIMTVMMAQRRCVVRLTRAGLRLGPRTDREGNAFVELDLDFADRYSTSH